MYEADPQRLKQVKEGVFVGEIMGKATVVCRDIANEPSNVMNPVRLAQTAKEVAQKNRLKINILDEPTLKKKGMGLLLGVAQSGSTPPTLTVLEYKPKKAKTTVGLVGKGVTFDSGGISPKPSRDMFPM